MLTILIAGGTGLIGKHLSRQLRGLGHNVIHFSRKQNLNAEFPAYAWDIDKGMIDTAALKQADAIINLAGSGIADKRWTAARKKDIIDSRVKSTALLAQFLKSEKHQVKTYVAASAIGFYGNRGDEVLTEDSLAGHGFLAESTIAWEQSIEEVIATGIRTVKIRIGVVLSKQGGALEQMLLPFLFRTGVYFGNGAQWFSWIHIDDLCRMFIWAVENQNIAGTFNGVAPHPLSNYDMTKAISEAKGGFNLLLPAPAFTLRIALGEMADVVLNSTRISAQKAVNQGFKFNHPEAVAALKDILKRGV